MQRDTLVGKGSYHDIHDMITEFQRNLRDGKTALYASYYLLQF